MPTHTSSSGGNWEGEADKFVGLKINNGTTPYYGWIRLCVNYNDNILIKDFACNLTPNAPIVAGEDIICNPNQFAIVEDSVITICEGQQATLHGSMLQSFGYFISWFHNDTLVGNGNQHLVDDPGNYFAVITDAFCSDTSEGVTLIVDPVPTVPDIALIDDTLWTTATGNFQWYYNSGFIPGATNSFYVPSVIGNYYVTVTNGFGCSSASINYHVSTISNTAVGELSSANIKAYAANNTLIVEIPYSDFKNYHVALFNHLGQQVLNAAITGMRTELPLQNLPAGIYEVVLQKGSARNIFKIVLQ